MTRFKFDKELTFVCTHCWNNVAYYHDFFPERVQEYKEKMLELSLCWVCVHKLCYFCKDSFYVTPCDAVKPCLPYKYNRFINKTKELCGRFACEDCGDKCADCNVALCKDCKAEYRCIECDDDRVLCGKCSFQCHECKTIKCKQCFSSAGSKCRVCVD